jgi:hypothetical protein
MWPALSVYQIELQFVWLAVVQDFIVPVTEDYQINGVAVGAAAGEGRRWQLSLMHVLLNAKGKYGRGFETYK